MGTLISCMKAVSRLGRKVLGPGQGQGWDTTGRAGRTADGLRVRSYFWPPLRLTRMALEAGSVVVVSPAGVLRRQSAEEGAMRSIGLDLGKHVAEVAISEPGRGTRSGGRISASPESLQAYAATLGPDDQVVLERCGPLASKPTLDT